MASRVKSVLRRIDGSRPTFLQSTNLQYPKPEMAFLHARDKELAHPTQAPLLETGTPSDSHSGDELPAAAVNHTTPDPANAGEDNYEGTVRLVAKTTGTVKELIRFIDSLRADPQIHLLCMVSNKRGDGMDVWLRLRAPKPPRSTLLAVAGVSRVEPAEYPESEPGTEVLKVSLD